MTHTRRDAAGLLGLASIVLAIAGEVCQPIWTFPATTASGSEVAAFFAAHREALKAAQVCNATAVALWFVLACGVSLRLRGGVPDRSLAGTLFVGGFAGLTTLLLAGFTCANVLIYRSTTPAEATLLYDLTFGLLAMSGLPTAVAMAAVAIEVYRHGGLPVRLAHLAAVTATAHVLLLASFIAPSGFLSLEGSMIIWVPAQLILWIGETAAFLVSRPRPALPPVPTPHPAPVR